MGRTIQTLGAATVDNILKIAINYLLRGNMKLSK